MRAVGVRVALLVALSSGCGSRSELEANGGGSSAAGTQPGQGSSSGAGTSAQVGDASMSAGDRGPDGTAAPTCVRRPTSGVVIAPFQGDTPSVVVTSSTLYVGTDFSGTNLPSTIVAVSLLDGGSRPVPAPEYRGGSLTSDGARIYYPRTVSTVTDSGTSVTAAGLVSLDLATGRAVDLPSPQVPEGYAASSDVPGVVWLGGPGKPVGLATAVYRWDPGSGNLSTVGTGQDLQGVAIDSTGIYWDETAGNENTIYRASLTGAAPVVLGVSPWSVVRGRVLGLTPTNVVFGNDGQVGSFSVDAVPKSGGAVHNVFTGNMLFGWVSDEDFYWSDYATQGSLWRVPIAGGTPERVWEQMPPGWVQSVAFDACNIYIGLENVGQVIARGK